MPQSCEICEPCKQYLDNGEEIPLPMLAKLIRFKLLDIKQQDINRREAEGQVTACLFNVLCIGHTYYIS